MARSIRGLKPRSPEEDHRDATPLELFFDLAFVVAIASASSGLHHAISEGHAGEGIFSFVLVFFAIWWAWMNFTWFASAYDNDDTLYRLLVFVQITGALIIATGVPQMFKTLDFTIMAIGYVVLRLPLVFQWFRVAKHDKKRRKTAQRYAWSITLAQSLWIGLLFLNQETRMVLIIPAIIMELSIPIWAERSARTPWHAEHITERYGLFTIIVLGESVLASSFAIEALFSAKGIFADAFSIVTGGLIILFSMWWVYFNQPDNDHLSSSKTAIWWGYGHLFIFASAAALGAGIAVLVDFVTGHSEISRIAANLAITVPVSVYAISIWTIHVFVRKKSILKRLITPIFVVLILLSSLMHYSILITGVLLVLLIMCFEIMKRKSENG